jgi:hypothetical protein
MKRSILALALILVLSSSVGCTSKHRQYTTDGTYYLDGTVITEDGNEWSYDTDTINGDGIAVVVRFDNNGTMIDITDDIILSINYKEYPCK